jgi:hypothetical protein
VTGNELKKLFLKLQKAGKVSTISDFAFKLGYSDRQAIYYYFNRPAKRLNYTIEDKVNAFLKEVK